MSHTMRVHIFGVRVSLQYPCTFDLTLCEAFLFVFLTSGVTHIIVNSKISSLQPLSMRPSVI